MYDNKGKATDNSPKTGREKKAGKNRGRLIKLPDGQKPKASIPLKPDSDDIVFALDIGTRTVVGVVGFQEGSCFRVIATETIEHKSRAMLDGQIHDVEQVAAVASEVKEKLEARLGIKLKKVAIAAAGRVLKTCEVRVERNLEQSRLIDPDLVNSLEIEGIQRAQALLDENLSSEEKTQFYCVGYSVISYYLNGYVISKLTGHKGNSIGADILATFLPMMVVDDLYTVMGKIGLEVASLTLEPIAAINVTIPPDLRLLNLVLVDVGAGTSDIAITKNGSVVAYAMVPIAGDEITEKISQHFLVDFNTGEKIKIALSSNKDIITFTDILKTKHTVTPEEVMDVIGDTLQMLAATISEKILDYNKKAPNAIFLVGGGSRIPGLHELLAKQLGMPNERVVVRGRDVIKDIKYDDKKLFGPESITPYGIAVTAQINAGKDFLNVTVNDKKVRLFNSKKLTVADALILYGYDASQLIGRSGKSLNFTLNGNPKSIRGEFGKAAEIKVNGKVSSLDTPIFYGDIISVIPAVNGRDAEVKAFELVPDYKTGIVRLNGNPVDISTEIYINGMKAASDTVIKNGDRVEVRQIETLMDLLNAGGYDPVGSDVYVNGNKVSELSYILRDGDQISLESTEPDALNKGSEPEENSFTGTVTGTLPENTANVPVNSEHSFQVSVNGRNITLDGSKSQYIFVDIFNYINFDLSNPKGNIVLRLNGRQAAFTDIIKPGDIIEIRWER